MAQSSTEKTTVARPYAEAVFRSAQSSDKLDVWSDMLGFLGQVTATDEISAIVNDPRVSTTQLTELLLDIGGGNLNEEGQNLVRTLAENGRVSVLPEIARQYDSLKASAQGSIEVDVTSAYSVNAAQKNKLAKALTEHLGREVHVSTHKDADLIGGVIIRAGDYVIDGSVRGRLQQLAATLNS